MKITIESTSKVVRLDMANDRSVPARIWQGETESGIPVQVFVTRIAPEIPQDHPDIDRLTAEFERDLKRQADPRPTVLAIPLRMIISLAVGCTAAMLRFGQPAAAHDAPTGWSYPFACCANYDCQEVPDASIVEGARGYEIRKTGELIPMSDKRVRQSPDGKFHWCAHQAGLDAGMTICLFVPPRGF